MLHWNLLTGHFAIALMMAGVVGATFLLARPGMPRRWWMVWVPCALLGASVIALLFDWLVTDVWKPFPDPLPWSLVFWIGVALAAITLTAVTMGGAGWQRRTIALVAALAIIVASVNQINRTYGYYPTLAAVFGVHSSQQIPLPPLDDTGGDAASSVPKTAAAGVGTSPQAHSPTRTTLQPDSPSGTRRTPHRHRESLAAWRPDGPVPELGTISDVHIPGTESGFHARSAWVYLPPAYLSRPRPYLPLLILLSGQPGSPTDWLNAGHLAATMDTYARRHRGLAPIVVIPDPTGKDTGNTMCVDSKLGNADSYLSRDVVDWARTHLQIDPDTAHWAVGGFSFGGTCAWQLAVSHPELFPTFLDISGQDVPTLGTDQQSIAEAFGGDAAAYQKIQPLSMLAATSSDSDQARAWRAVSGIFAVGAGDHPFGAAQRVVTRACRQAGIAVTVFDVAGSHSWYVAAKALVQALPQLAERMGVS